MIKYLVYFSLHQIYKILNKMINQNSSSSSPQLIYVPVLDTFLLSEWESMIQCIMRTSHISLNRSCRCAQISSRYFPSLGSWLIWNVLKNLKTIHGDIVTIIIYLVFYNIYFNGLFSYIVLVRWGNIITFKNLYVVVTWALIFLVLIFFPLINAT